MRRVLVLALLAGAMAGSPALAAKARKPAAKPPAARKAPAAKPAPAPPAPPAVPAAPAEPPLFTIFRTVCIGHQGDIAAAEAEARRQGFSAVPPSPDEDPATASLRTVLQRDQGGLQAVVFLTRAPKEVLAGAPNAEGTLCGVAGPDPQGATAGAAKAWVGVVSNSQDGTHLSFLYRQTAEQRVAMADMGDPAIRAAVAAGEYRVFDVGTQGEVVTLGLLTGRTLPPKP